MKSEKINKLDPSTALLHSVMHTFRILVNLEQKSVTALVGHTITRFVKEKIGGRCCGMCSPPNRRLQLFGITVVGTKRVRSFSATGGEQQQQRQKYT